MSAGCIVCHRPLDLSVPGRNSADQWCCRACQLDPMPQLRAHLERARAAGMPFDRAWPWAIQRVRWPHNTAQRREWKWLLGVEIDGTIVQARTNARILLEWRAAYERAPARAADAFARVVTDEQLATA